jgi:hypothetical protein
LRSEKAELAADVAQMQANVTALEKKGGRIVLNTCGARLCIEASSNQGTDDGGKQFPIGSWKTTDGRKGSLVIPRGY